MGKFDLPENTPGHVFQQLIGKNWGELEILEEAGRLLFPETIYRKKKDGTFEEIKILVQVPRMHELRKARVTARKLALEDGLDVTMDRDLIDDLECVCTLSLCLRRNKPPYEPWNPFPRDIEKNYDWGSIKQIWAKLDEMTSIVDPAPDSISENEMIALASAIARERNIAPLLVYGSAAQSTYIITMADLLMSLLASKSSSEPSDSSTQESSPTNDS